MKKKVKRIKNYNWQMIIILQKYCMILKNETHIFYSDNSAITLSIAQ